MPRPISMDKEKVTFNLARFKKAGEVFEIVIDPDFAVKYKEGDKTIDVKDVIRSENIFADAKKGLQASEEHYMAVFSTEDTVEIAKKILDEGELQFTREYRDNLRRLKLNRIIDYIQRNAIDPKTNLIIPRTRIENAVEELKLKVEELQTAEQQVDYFVKKMMPLFPIKLQQLIVQLEIPSAQAHQSYGVIKKYAEIRTEKWGPNGELLMQVKLPAGLRDELIGDLNKLCHSEIVFKIIKE